MEEERWWSDGETMETAERSGEMNAQCEKPKYSVRANYKGNSQQTRGRALDVGPTVAGGD